MSTNQEHECAAPRTTTKEVLPSKEQVFLLWQKNKMIFFFFFFTFTRVFDSFLFIKGLWVWRRSSYYRVPMNQQHVAQTEPPVHIGLSLPTDPGAALTSGHGSASPVKHIFPRSHNLQISPVMEILWSSLWLRPPSSSVWACMSYSTVQTKWNRPEPKQQLAF